MRVDLKILKKKICENLYKIYIYIYKRKKKKKSVTPKFIVVNWVDLE